MVTPEPHVYVLPLESHTKPDPVTSAQTKDFIGPPVSGKNGRRFWFRFCRGFYTFYSTVAAWVIFKSPVANLLTE